VARVRGVPIEQVNALIASNTQAPLFGLLGESRVNVLSLNVALDKVK
jgi:K+-transporting ATPase ATPase C chain